MTKPAVDILQGWRVSVNLPLERELDNNGLLYEHKCLGVALDILEEILSLPQVDPTTQIYDHEAYRTEGRNDCLDEIRLIAETRVAKWREREEEIKILIEQRNGLIRKIPGT